MDRSVLRLSPRDKIANTEIRDSTKVIDAIERITTFKWNWAGHIARVE